MSKTPQEPVAFILVVDDDPQLRDIYRLALSSPCYRVTMAVDGKDALSHYQTAMNNGEPFDLVLLDWSMPVMSGEECMARPLAMDSQANIYIATGYAAEDIRKKSSSEGCRGILHKPMGLASIRREIQTGLKKRGSRTVAYGSA